MTVGSIKIKTLDYADDIVFIASSPHGMQLNVKINLEKSMIIALEMAVNSLAIRIC